MKKLFTCLFILFAAFCLTACVSGEEEKKGATKADITVEFEGASSITVSADGVFDLPSVELGAGQSLLGWSLKANDNKATFKDDVTYADVADYAANGKLKLYPVIESKITLVMKGITEVTTQLSNITLNTATLPLVAQSDRQKFIGWAATEGASEAQIEANAAINYNTVSKLAQNANVTLYPVVVTYDIMICAHGSHSNGNIYMSAAQRTQLLAALQEAFPNANILIDYVDAVSATNFAKEAVKKDYDILLTSKTARGLEGDIANAAADLGKTIYAEEDSEETVLTTIDLNQSRQVCRVLGSEEVKPYQDQVYAFLTTPVDQVIEITFKQGEKQDVVEAHRVVDGAINNAAYTPSDASGVMVKGEDVFDGWTSVEGGTEVEFANANYKNVAAVAVDGKVTLYPVFKKAPDCTILVWGMNGTNEYVSEAQYDQMVALFNNYLTEHSISKEGKDIQVIYFTGKTDDFKAELTKSYVLAAVGANAMQNDDYSAYWTVNTDMFAKVVNVSCTNTSRYCGLRSGAEANEFAVAFFNALCSANITVKFSDGTNTSAGYTANSLTLNVIDLPEQFAPAAGKVLSGYATTANGEVVITGNVTYNTALPYATNGEVTLYPQYEEDMSYDLTVAILCGTETKTYITAEEVAAIQTAFTTYAAENGYVNVNVEYIVNLGATGANFIAALPATTDVYVGASNLTSQTGFPGMYAGESWTNIIRMMENTSRYCGVVATCNSTQYELAKLFVEMLCKPEEAPSAITSTTCTVAYHAYGKNESTTYFTAAMLAQVQADVNAALVELGVDPTTVTITWTAYNGQVAGVSSAIVTAAPDVCIAHTQVFNPEKTSTPFGCCSAAPATQFTQSTDNTQTFYCGSALKVGVATASADNDLAMLIYSVIAGYAA